MVGVGSTQTTPYTISLPQFLRDYKSSTWKAKLIKSLTSNFLIKFKTLIFNLLYESYLMPTYEQINAALTTLQLQTK